MRIINIHVTQGQDDLVIHFDLLTDVIKKTDRIGITTCMREENKLPLGLIKKIGQSLTTEIGDGLHVLRFYLLFAKGALDKILDIKATNHAFPYEHFDHFSTQMVLAKMPHLAIGLLGCIAYYVNLLDNIKVYTCPTLLETLAQAKTKNLTLNQLELGNPHTNRGFSMLMSNLLNVDHPPGYKNVIDLLATLNTQYQVNGCTFFVNEIINPERYLRVAANALYPRETYKPSISDLIQYAKNMIRQGEASELSFHLQCLNYTIKKSLFEAVIGQPAHDKGNYGWHYTELYFLMAAEFRLNSDHSLSIVNIQQNPFFQKYYSSRNSAPIFREEMKFLMNLLGLELSPDSDFQQEIKFSLSSSKQLHDSGVLLTEQYVKQYFSVKNSWAFFTGRDGKRLSLIEQLPNEIKEHCLGGIGSNSLGLEDYSQAMNEGISVKI